MKNRRKRSLVTSIVIGIISTYLVAFFALNAENSYLWGQKYMNIGIESGYKSAVFNYRLAIFEDRYLHFFQDHINLPKYYYALGSALTNLYEYEDAKEAFISALSLYEKYEAEADTVALTKVQLEFTSAYMDQNEDVIYYGTKAIEYYQETPETPYKNAAAMAYLLLAGAYFTLSDYEKAAGYLEVGIPMYYDQVDWGINDTHAVNLLSVMYKMAEKANYKSGNTERGDYYSKQYEDFIWLHEVKNEDMKVLTDGFHWNLEIE